MKENSNRLPFNWHNPIGYLTALAFQCTLLLNGLRYMAVMMTLAVASYLFVMKIFDNTISDMRSFNKCAKTKRQQHRTSKLLSQWICAHSETKKFSKINTAHLDMLMITFQIFSRLIGEFSNLYETVLAAVFAGSTVAMCFAMLMIQMQIVEYIYFSINLIRIEIFTITSQLILF